MLGLAAKIDEAAASIRATWKGEPRVGLILGTGLGGLASQIEQEAVIAYGDIPHFPTSTVESHAGQLVCGNLAGVPIVALGVGYLKKAELPPLCDHLFAPYNFKLGSLGTPCCDPLGSFWFSAGAGVKYPTQFV